MEAIAASAIQWAPDGDGAFDEGSKIFPLDFNGLVRLIAFKVSEDVSSIYDLSDLQIKADGYYGCLSDCLEQAVLDREGLLSIAVPQ